jgi:DNA-binding protein YbaB
MRNFQKAVAVIALSGLCLAAPAPSDSDTAAKKSTKHHAARPVKKDETAEKLRNLKETVDQQQATMQQMQQQLQQTQQQLQQTQQQLVQTQQTAQAADAKVATVETNSNMQVQKVQADLSDVKTALNTTTQTVQKDDKKLTELEHPPSIAYKGIRITPGGFLEMTGYFRTHATLSDQATPFQTIPLGGFAGGAQAPGAAATEPGANPYLTEFGETARDSRITLRADADAGKTKLAGYFEMDFFGTSPTANPNQTTSYTPRIRQAWGRAKFANGWTITGGQVWTLLTLNRKGTDVDNANLWIPNIIEAQYSVGYDWGRFAEVRLSKQIGSKLNLAIALDNPSYLNSGATNTTATVAGVASLGAGLLGNSLVSTCSTTLNGTVPETICTNTPTYSTNLAPDTIVKLAFDDPKLGHFEIKGIQRFFRDRVVSTATAAGVITPGWNNTAIGGGIGAGAVIPVVPHKVDFIAQGMYGKGISRYEDAGQYDFLVRSTDHNLQTLKSFSVLAGFETHPSRKVEIDALFGDEYYYRDLYATATGALTGYGAYTANNGACGYESAAIATAAGAGDACTGNNKNLWNAKLFGYYDLYKGPVGTLRYGAEVDYIERETWSGALGLAPKGNEKTVFTTMRYIFP